MGSKSMAPFNLDVKYAQFWYFLQTTLVCHTLWKQENSHALMMNPKQHVRTSQNISGMFSLKKALLKDILNVSLAIMITFLVGLTKPLMLIVFFMICLFSCKVP